MDAFRDNELVVVSESPGASVQQLVMEHTKRNAIFFDVRATSLVPFHMGGFQAYRSAVELDVVAAYGATVRIRAENAIPKFRIAGRLFGAMGWPKI